MAGFIRDMTQQEQLNFLLTNRIPRQLATRFMGWYSDIESPLLTRVSLAIWRAFADDLNLEEAREQNFTSLNACFTRQLKPGVREIDQRPGVVCSPCDAIVGATGIVENGQLYQAKGFPYELQDLVPRRDLQRRYADGIYITLRLKSSMYHRFHAPINGRVRRVDYIAGDTWNVNPIALKRIANLYCRNERAVLEIEASTPDQNICLVPVAAILVASIRLHCLPPSLDMAYRGPEHIVCNQSYQRGEEMGYFRHGSTIILFAPRGHKPVTGITPGLRVKMGQALLTQPDQNPEPIKISEGKDHDI